MHNTLDRLAELLRAVARDEIMPRLRRTIASHKADGSLVTETDLAVQRRIVDSLAEQWPDIPVLAEEMEQAEQQRLVGTGEATFWCLDPLDGTSNYACGFPAFAISLALVRKGRAELGLVLDPVRNECFTAARGQGAFVDGTQLHPYTPGDQLSDCLGMLDLKRLPPQRIPALFRDGSFRSQRNLGAVALEWCWLAAGRFQLYLHGGQRLWDYAAGRLIADEAGVVSSLYSRDGIETAEPSGLDTRLAIAAANRTLFDQWRTFIDLPLRAEGAAD